MNKEIFDFLKVSKVQNILLLSSENEEIKNELDKVHQNITKINNINELKEYIQNNCYDLLILENNENIIIKDFLKLLKEKYDDIPLIIFNQNLLEKTQNIVSEYHLQISPLFNENYLIYNFEKLDTLLNSNLDSSPQIENNLNKIYKLNYYDNPSSFYPFKLLTNYDKIGGLKSFPVNIKGYKLLNDEENLDIGYYLRKNNIKKCEDVRLHYLLNAYKNGYNPNSKFKRDDYLTVNPDLKDLKYDPFLHYIVYGKKENRQTNLIKGEFQTNINDNILKGWIAEINNNNALNADVVINNKTYPILADIYREDLKKNGINEGSHGFEFEVPNEYRDGKDHTIELRYENRTMSKITYNYLNNTAIKHEPKTIKGSFQSNIKDSLVKGWIAEIGNYNPVNAYIKIEGKKFNINADIYREDLKRNNINVGKHGFEFNVPVEFIDGKNHLLELYGPNDKKISQINHTFANYDYENNIERYFSNSMTSPEMVLPAVESRKKILALMNNIAKYLINQIKKEELVSIIMPTFNREEFIENAIKSVLEQSYKNFELIIIDDCSTDDTINLINNFNDNRIRLITNSSNMGVSKSRNIGLKESKGKYIMYLDSDNDWEKDYVKATVGAFTLLKDADAIYSGQYIYENSKDNLKYIRYGTINKGLVLNRNYVDLNCFSHTRDIYEREGGFDETLQRFVDWDLTLNYMTNGKVYSVPFILSNYYFNIAENSISNSAKYIELQEEILNKQIERLNSKKYDFDITHGISVIIPSYESLNDLEECLESLFNLNASWLEIIVVDNNSSEDVIRYLVNLKDEGKIKLILNKKNMGFTFAVNQGIEISDINNDILLLNNDAVVTENAIQLLQKAAYELENCGMTVPQQILPANTKTINTHVPYANKNVECDVNLSAHHKNVINVPLFHNGEYTELSFAPFFCVYIKRDTYNKSIGLDAELGRHFRSDMIYCNYVRTVLNQKIYHVSEARVYHKLQQATSTLKEKSVKEHDLLYVQNRWSKEEQEKYGFERAKWDL